MPSLLLPRFSLQDMSDKKSPPRKEKPFIVRTPQPDDKGMKRKLLSPASPTHDDDDKKTPNKRKRVSLSLESSPMTNPKTPSGGSRSVPLSERQQLAMIMRMSDETSQENTVKPPSPTPLMPIKKTQFDKKVFKRNERGEMPIHLAAIRGDIKLLKKLIKAGADVNVADFAGWTPLHEASNRGWISIAKHLLKAGANVNVQGLENDTPLHDASINGHKKLVELLLKHGANPLQPNAKGKTPLDVAPSTDMIKILKKETICSGSDTSSIEDVRSPLSPDSIISMKDEDKSLDSEDMQQNSRSESFSSSSSCRRLSMPKSPDSKLSSPRLCLKFHRDNFGYTNQKSRDSNEPQYKSYSVTNMSVDSTLDNPMFSPADSPASSVDSDLYNPRLDQFTNFSGSKLKISLPDDENSKQDSQSSIMISVLNAEGKSLVDTKEVFPNQSSETGDHSTDWTSSFGTTSEMNCKSVLKPAETLPFQPNTQWSESQNEDSMDLPDLEIDTSDSIPKNTDKENGTFDSVKECNSVSSSSVTSPSQSGVNHSSVTSSTELKEQMEVLNADTNSLQVTSNSHEADVKESDQISEATEVDKMTELSSTVVTSAISEGSCSCATSSSKNEGSDNSNNTVPCSPNQTERDSRDSRPSTPKVPPLKIIIPPKLQAISEPTDTNERLKVGNKSALPYVINPYQDQGREPDTQFKGAGIGQESDLNPSAQPVDSLNNLDVTNHSDSDNVLKVKKQECDQNDVENSDMEVESSEVNNKKPSQDYEMDDKDKDLKSDNDSKKDENKKDQPPQRVLRSAVRSQQLSVESKQPKQQKQTDKSDQSSSSESPTFKDEMPSSVVTNKPTKEEEDMCIHPRKRKVKQKADSVETASQGDGESPVPMNTTVVTEKVPNPFEIYLCLRKKIASRRHGYLDMLSICPKTPQGFKDYLLRTCNYVLQGNSSSTLSVPTLSPPNSVKDKMRDQFVKQEEARYKLRLQHLIEREKLILSIEQEILREHGRAARALANQGTPLSVCTILRDEEIYNFTEDQVRLEEKDKKNRTRYNGRQFLSWIQDVDDKYEKIKELLILRQKQEADSLYAYQRLEWEWKLKELSLCDRNATPEIDELHVPLVTVQDNFDLLPT